MKRKKLEEVKNIRREMYKNMKYITPKQEIIYLEDYSVLCSSNRIEHMCSSWCKHWHVCQDRLNGKMCEDFAWK